MKITKKIMIFVVLAFICAGMLTAVNLIPQSAIEKNAEVSTNYLADKGAFPVLIDGAEFTRIDNYADGMLLNVTYNVNNSRPFYSMIADRYYRIDDNSGIDDLRSAVIQKVSPQNEYSRYWHGMQIFLRPLLIVFSINVIRYIFAAVLLALNIWLCILLCKREHRNIAKLYLVSVLAVDLWMGAFSIEYISIFILMTAMCIFTVYFNGKYMDGLFIAGGLLSCFFDFLTTETLTFTIPLILYFLMRYDCGEHFDWKKSLKNSMIWGLEWILSYACMFLVKWGLVYAMCGRESFMNAIHEAAYRMNGSVLENGNTSNLDFFTLRKVAILRNIGCLLHIGGKATSGIIIVVFLLVMAICASIFYLFRKKNYDGKLVVMFLLIGTVPYARMLVLANHACMHFFFTYRALMAMVLAVAAALYVSVDMKQYVKKKRRRK